MSKAYNMGTEENEDELAEDVVKNPSAKDDERKKQEMQNLFYLLEKDPHARKAAIEAGNQASRQALQQGLSNEEVKKIAQEAMLLVLAQYRPATVTIEKGLESAIQIRDQFVEKENEKNNIFTAEFEVNDYPQ